MKRGAQLRGAELHLKRVYEPPGPDDGLRVLVDRLWPRGLAKAKARIDHWLKEIAPSDGLRRELHAEPAQWNAFVAAYRRELEKEPAASALASLRELMVDRPVTLLYAAHDEAHNNAVALKAYLESKR